MADARIVTSWNRDLRRFPPARYDAYFLEDYVRLYEYQGYSAECFVYEEDADDVFLFPYLRALPDNELAPHDITTAYGYGGPIVNRSDKALFSRGWRAMQDVLAGSGARSICVRFNPLLENHEMVPSTIPMRSVRMTVGIDLVPNVEDIWSKQLDSNSRNMVRKAESSGLDFAADDSFRHLDEFVEIYTETMTSLVADQVYLFNGSYYRSFPETFSDNSTLCVVTEAGAVIAGALFVFSGPYVHYHLSGSRRDALRLRPNDLLLYRAALEFRQRGFRVLHLGGGRSDSPDDGLWRFKRRFGNLTYEYCATEIPLP